MGEDIEYLQSVYQQIAGYLVAYSFQILGALVIVFIGYQIAKRLGKLVEKLLTKKKIDITLSRFIGNSTHIIILVMVGIIALGQLGISVTPFVAAIGALSLGVGLAMQGMLSNYACGLTIIFTRPFVVGDTIQVQGVTGLVDSVHLGFTILIDEDEVRIQIPNRLVIGEIIHNSNEHRLLELEIGVAYGSDPHQVIEVIQAALKSVELVSQNPPPQVGIEAFADSSINMGVRFFALTERFFEIRYQANLAIHDALKQADIQIPFPQREVRMLPAELEG